MDAAPNGEPRSTNDLGRRSNCGDTGVEPGSVGASTGADPPGKCKSHNPSARFMQMSIDFKHIMEMPMTSKEACNLIAAQATLQEWGQQQQECSHPKLQE